MHRDEPLQLTDEQLRILEEIEEKLARISGQARKIANGSGLTRREIADRMGHTSPSTVQRLLAGAAYNATLETVARFADACDHRLHMEFLPKASVAASRPGNVVLLEHYRNRPNSDWTSGSLGANSDMESMPLSMEDCANVGR